jgi:hypothetical protein
MRPTRHPPRASGVFAGAWAELLSMRQTGHHLRASGVFAAAWAEHGDAELGEGQVREAITALEGLTAQPRAAATA